MQVDRVGKGTIWRSHSAMRLARMAACGLLLGCLSTAAWAQDFRNYRPQEPPTTSGEANLPEPETEVTGSPEILLDELKGLVFVDRPNKVQALAPTISGIHIDPNSDLRLLRSPAFARVVEPYLGKPVSLRQLNAMVRDIIRFYRRHDLPVVDVSVPEQDIISGTVQIVVVEGRVGQVRVEGPCWFDPCWMVRQPCTYPGGRIVESVLLEDLEWLNRNPFREVDLELTPGKEFGDTDVVFKVRDQMPARVYAGYEDSGTRPLGIERTIYGVNLGNVWGRDHQAAYQYTASSDFESLEAHSGVYSMPLLNRDTWTFFGSWAEVNGGVADPFDQGGKAWQASTRYNYSLCDRMCRQYEHFLTVGFDFKQTNTNLEFGGLRVFASAADIAQMVFGYHGRYSDTQRAWAWGADMFISPSGFSPGNNDTAFQAIRAGAQAEYYYARAYLERQERLGQELVGFVRLTGQVAGENLLPSEQLGFGGFDTIRGYDMRLVNGDSGYICNLELRTRGYNLLTDEGDDNPDMLQGLVFWDFGHAINHTRLPGEKASQFLSGVGPGFRYSMGPNIQVRCDYGWQLYNVRGQEFLGSPRSRFHVGAVLAY